MIGRDKLQEEVGESFGIPCRIAILSKPPSTAITESFAKRRIVEEPLDRLRQRERMF
jgi:hypothetical protein